MVSFVLFTSLLSCTAAILFTTQTTSACLQGPEQLCTIRSPKIALKFDSLKMVVDSPVKIPDAAPVLAPQKPSSEKGNEKAKKFKLLLFNDNVNRF